MQNIGDTQIELIKKANKYIRDLESKGVDVGASSICYLQPYNLTPGYFKLKSIIKKIKIRNFIYQIRYFLSILKFQNYQCISDVPTNVTNCKTVVVSWAKKSDFSETGKYTDSIFRHDSENKDIFWFLIYSDYDLPEKIDKNIIIFYKKKNKYILNFFLFIKYLFATFKKNKFSILKNYHELSSLSCFAYLVDKSFNKIFKNKKIEKIIFPYESQPFQNVLIKSLKSINKKNISIGYNHGMSPLPLYNLYKTSSPDLLYVNSESAKNFYHSYFNWPLNKLIHIPSIKISKKDKSFYKNKIFLPYDIINSAEIIKNLSFFLKKCLKSKFKPLVVRNHPHQLKSTIHEKLSHDIETLLKTVHYQGSEKSAEDVSIFIGGTATIIEALETGLDVIQIVDDPVFECYSSELWPSIKVETISNKIFKYSLKEFGKCLNFKNTENGFDNILRMKT